MLNLKIARIKAGIKQEDLAKEIGASKTDISRYENGHNYPSIERLSKMADILDVSVDYLIGRNSEMKDYRMYHKRYFPNEWEEDNEWLSKRLEFLWTFRDYYPKKYSDLKLSEEKEDLYEIYGSTNIMARASQLHYEQYENNKFNFENKNNNELFSEYKRLIDIKKNDIDQFLRRRIYIKYYLLKEYIKDNLQEEYYFYKKEQ